MLNFQIQVPPHDDTKILNICVYRDDQQGNALETNDQNLKIILSNPKYGIKVSVSKEEGSWRNIVNVLLRKISSKLSHLVVKFDSW